MLRDMTCTMAKGWLISVLRTSAPPGMEGLRVRLGILGISGDSQQVIQFFYLPAAGLLRSLKHCLFSGKISYLQPASARRGKGICGHYRDKTSIDRAGY